MIQQNNTSGNKRPRTDAARARARVEEQVRLQQEPHRIKRTPISKETREIIESTLTDYREKFQVEEEAKRFGGRNHNNGQPEGKVDLEELVKNSFQKNEFSDPWDYVSVLVKSEGVEHIVHLKVRFFYNDGIEDVVDKKGNWYQLGKNHCLHVARTNGSSPNPPHKSHLVATKCVVGKIL